MDPDQDRQNVGPDLGPNCLQRLSADDKNEIYTKLNPLYTGNPKQVLWQTVET